MPASVENKSVKVFLDAKNRGHITKEWKWHVAGILDPCMGLLRNWGVNWATKGWSCFAKCTQTESCFYQWVIWENLSIKIIPPSARNKVYNNSFFTPGFLGRFGDIIPAVYHGTKGRLNKFHHLLPLIVGYRWLSLVVRESTAWVWNPANYWEPSTSGQWIKLSMLLFLYLLKVDMCCYLSHREF